VVLYGLLMTGIGTVVVAYLSDVLPARDLSSAFGAITLSLGVAQLVAPPLGGWLADLTGSFGTPFLVAAIAGGIAAVVAALLPGRQARAAHAAAREAAAAGAAGQRG
jgi:MFS family permease